MGRAKIEIKRLEDEAKAKVTFSKRRDGLLKKAKELAILCDVDVAVIAFSPSGKLVQFCNRSIGDVIERFDASHERQEKSHCTDAGNLSTLRDQVWKLQAELSASKELSGMLWGDEICLQRLNLVELERLGAQLRESHQKVLHHMGCLRSYGVPAHGSYLNVHMAAETSQVSALTHQGVEPRYEVQGSGTEQSSSTLHGAETYNVRIEAITEGSGTGHMYSASQLEERQYYEPLMQNPCADQAGTSLEEESELGSEAITEYGARSGASRSLQEWQGLEQLLQDPCADPEAESEGSEAIAEGSGAGHNTCNASQSLQEWQNYKQLLLQVRFPDPTGAWKEEYEGSEAIREGSVAGHDTCNASQSLQGQGFQQLVQDPCADPEAESEGSEAIAEGSGAGHNMCSASQSLQEWQNYKQLLLQVRFPDPTGAWKEEYEGSTLVDMIVD